MVIARAPVLSRGLGRVALGRTSHVSRSKSWRQLGRRTYASGHGEQQSSELPWIIGSLAVTVPAAGWLLQQGPTKSDHGHDTHKEEHKDEDADEPEAESDGGEDQPAEESKDEDKSEEKNEEKSEGKDGGDEGKEDEEGSDEKQQDDDSDKEKSDGKGEESQEKGKDDYPAPSPGSPGQINWKPGMNKGPGEGQKGERKPSEKKGEKDGQGNHSGAKHPYIDDAEKSKKGAGVTETAKIHGTVDSRQSVR